MPGNRIFVSYSSADRARVAGLAPLLEALGHEVFFDRRSIVAGEKWKAKIDASLAEADAMLVFWTRHAERSEWVRYEYERFVTLHPDGMLSAVLGDETALSPLLAERQSTDFVPLVNELLEMKRRLESEGIKHDAIRDALLNRLKEAGIELDEGQRRKLFRLFVPVGLAGMLAAPSVVLSHIGNLGGNAVATLSAAQVGVVAAAAVGGAVVCNVVHEDPQPLAAVDDGREAIETRAPHSPDGTSAIDPLEGLIDPYERRDPDASEPEADPDATEPPAPAPPRGIAPRSPALLEDPVGVADCAAIDCDCDGISAGLLTGPWRDQCRAEEADLMARCEASGTMPTAPCSMSGPDTFPPK